LEPVIKGRGHVIGFPEAPASKQEPDAIFRALIHLIDCFSSSSSSSSSSSAPTAVVAADAADVVVVVDEGFIPLASDFWPFSSLYRLGFSWEIDEGGQGRWGGGGGGGEEVRR